MKHLSIIVCTNTLSMLYCAGCTPVDAPNRCVNGANVYPRLLQEADDRYYYPSEWPDKACAGKRVALWIVATWQQNTIHGGGHAR